jgi:hypothetical protein
MLFKKWPHRQLWAKLDFLTQLPARSECRSNGPTININHKPCTGAVDGLMVGVREKLAPFYREIGRPSIDPQLLIRMVCL